MRMDGGTWCPMIKKECAKFKCAWFTKISGYDTNTGKDVEEWGCAMAFMPMLLIENSGQQRQTGAAVETFRNEMVKANEASNLLLLQSQGVESAEQLLKVVYSEAEEKSRSKLMEQLQEMYKLAQLEQTEEEEVVDVDDDKDENKTEND